mmetsp:Transcript_10753/g.25326  ORF Transcript_10753/g.25326 Transcript_10753/m.25326 type:complete len:377 (+) Transcript_10753:521-1651(+)
MASIFSLMPCDAASYRCLKLPVLLAAGSAHAAITARPSAAAPAPPCAKCVASTESYAPPSMAIRDTSATSASVSVWKRFTATTTETPWLRTLRMCASRLTVPASTRGKFSSVYSLLSAAPATTLGARLEWSLRARTVHTSTAQLGFRPEARHLILKNFSPPMSDPKPASVSTYPSLPTSLRAIRSATTDELPCAMLAKGPQCTRAGVPSSVCIVVGMSASISSTQSAPVMPKSSAVSGSPEREKQAIMRPRRARRSGRSVARASTAMISEATVILKPLSRSKRSPFLLTSLGPRPSVTPRRKRSLVSVTRAQVTLSGSMSRRQKAATCASLSLDGDRSEMPSFVSRACIEVSKARAPSRAGGQSLLKMKALEAVAS